MSLNQELHNRLWRAFQRWEELRKTGVTKHELKMRGIRESGDPNQFTRNLIFTGNTLRSYAGVLREFMEHARLEYGAERLEDIGKRALRSFMDRGIGQALAAKTLNRYRSALAKFGSLTGQTAAFVGICQHYGVKIRHLQRSGQLPGPNRKTPSREILDRAIQLLQEWDIRHFNRMDEVRAYHLAARLQLETGARSVSATERVSRDSLLDGNRIVLVGKGGKCQTHLLSPGLHRTLSLYLRHSRGPLASLRGYRSAFARAILAVGGRVPGTHGARRRSVRDRYGRIFREGMAAGLSRASAARKAAGDAIESLGHGRDRRDHRAWYLGQ